MQFTEAAAQELAEFQQYFGGRDLHPLTLGLRQNPAQRSHGLRSGLLQLRHARFSLIPWGEPPGGRDSPPFTTSSQAASAGISLRPARLLH